MPPSAKSIEPGDRLTIKGAEFVITTITLDIEPFAAREVTLTAVEAFPEPKAKVGEVWHLKQNGKHDAIYVIRRRDSGFDAWNPETENSWNGLCKTPDEAIELRDFSKRAGYTMTKCADNEGKALVSFARACG